MVEPRSRGISRREAEVLGLVCQHLMNSEIAARLFVSERTVESHVSALMRKLGAANRRELAVMAGSGSRPVLPAALELAAEARPLLGRDAELGQLLDQWRQTAAAGRRLAAVVLGEAGIGKTRLVAEVAAAASGEGATVLLASCREDDVAPYRPLADAVAADLGTLPEDEAARRTANLPALDVLLAGGRPAAGPGDALWEQEAVHRAVGTYLARAAERGPVLLVVDDLHWAAPSTGRAVAALLQPAPPAPVLVVATCRDTTPDLEGGTRDILAGVLRSPAVTRIDLAGLDATAIAELAGPSSADGLWAETRGNPLFALELLASRSGRTGPTLASLVHRRAARLDEPDRQLLDLAATAGAEFDVRLLSAAAGRDATTTVDALERIEAAGLVWPLPGSPGHWAFVHPVFRRVRYDGLGGARRQALHDSLATALEDRPPLGTGADLAHHAYAAYPLGDHGRALAACRQAGERAAAVHAVDEAVDHFRAALDVATGGEGDETVCCELSIRVGALLHTAGRSEGATALAAAAGEARRLGDGRLLGEIAWALSHFGSGLMGMPSTLITGLVNDALELVDPADVAVRARLLGLRASQLAFAGDTLRARSVSDYALGLARALDDPVVVGEVLLTRRLAIFTPTTLDLRLQTVAEMAALGDGHGWRTLSLLGRLGLASFRREQGDLAASGRALDEATALMDGTPPAWITLLATAMTANRHLLAGDLVTSEQAVGRLLALPVSAGAGLSAVVAPATWAEPHLLAIRHCQGRLAELRDDAGWYASFGGAGGPVRTCALAHAGHVDEARADLDRWAADGFRSFPEDITWLTAMVMLAEAASVTGHVETAVILGDLLAPYAGRLDNYGDGSLSSVDLALAQTALVAPPAGGAERVAAAAVSRCRRAGAPILLGRALVCLSAAGATRAPLQEALDIAARAGALLIEQDAARYGLL